MLLDAGLNQMEKQKYEFVSFVPGSRSNETLLGSVEWLHLLLGRQDYRDFVSPCQAMPGNQAV